MPFSEIFRSMFRGDSKIYRLSVTDRAGTAVDISSDDVIFTVKRNADDLASEAVITKTTALASEIERPPAGGATNQADIKIVPADTVNEEPGELVFDVEITRAGTGAVHTVVKGVLTLEEDVTN